MKRALLIIGLLLVTGCPEDKKDETKPATTATAEVKPQATVMPTATATATVAAEEPPPPDDVTLPEDLEPEIKTTITKDNMENELAKLEKDITSAKN
jgi:hypothetical protein